MPSGCRFLAWQKMFFAILVALNFCIFVPANAAGVVETDDPPMLQGVGIPTYVWQRPGTRPQAIVVGFHGGCLHGRAYNALARQLADRGLMFVSFDMRGYGKWYHNDYGTKADRTFNYTRTIEDIRKLLATLHSHYPRTPMYSMGESLGANMALVIADKFPTSTDGVILVSPYFSARKFFDPHFISQLAQVMVLPFSELDMSPYLKKRLSQSPQLAMQQINDPMSRDKQTVKELGQSLMLNWSGRRKAKDFPSNMSMLIVCGEKDGLCNPKVTEKVFRRIPIQNKRMVILPNTGHLIVESSKVSAPVVSMLSSWIAKQNRFQLARKTSSPRRSMVGVRYKRYR